MAELNGQTEKSSRVNNGRNRAENRFALFASIINHLIKMVLKAIFVLALLWGCCYCFDSGIDSVVVCISQ